MHLLRKGTDVKKLVLLTTFTVLVCFFEFDTLSREEWFETTQVVECKMFIFG